jgi:DNA topoisomerase-1
MPYTLVIVESPAKCKKIEEYLGNGYKCIASFGHITELNGIESIDISNNFTPRFAVDNKKVQQIEKIKKAITNSSDVLIATDDDREGEAIGWHICQHFKLNVNTTKRIIFNEITQSALQKAVRNPLTLNLDLVYAQQARQILDVLVGYKISPVLWKYIKLENRQVLSAGRCQTPALNLIYDNQREIDNSPNKVVYNTTGYFTSKNIPFELDYNYETEESIGTFLEESVNHQHVFSLSEAKNTTKNPPSPFITSTIQQAASNEFRFSPKETMSLCQKLYEGGFITYMRTDSKIYSKEFIDKSKEFIRSEYGEEYIHANIDLLAETGEVKKSKKKKDDDKVKAQEAHEAIRPTDILRKILPDDMETKEKKLYKLIWTNTVESCMSPAIYKSITATISAPEDHNYKCSTEQVVFPGWKMVDGYDLINPTYSFIQTIKNNSRLNYNKVLSKITMKETKQHYTEAKLVQLLEEKGIGRPSTFSALIDKIQTRGYVKKENVIGKKIKCVDFELVDDMISEITNEREFGNEKGKLVIQPIGIVVSEFLTKYYDELFKYEYTKYMEDILDNIAKGNTIWHELCRECFVQIEGSTSRIDLVGKISTNQNQGDGEDEDGNGAGKKENSFTSKKLGKYNNEILTLKRGKFGLYVVWGENKKSLNGIEKEVQEITLDDVITYINRPITTPSQIQGQHSDNPNMVRYINNDMSIRKGKYGDYMYYKTKTMKTPKFLSLTKYKGDYKTDTVNSILSWVRETHQIS